MSTLGWCLIVAWVGVVVLILLFTQNTYHDDEGDKS